MHHSILRAYFSRVVALAALTCLHAALPVVAPEWLCLKEWKHHRPALLSTIDSIEFVYLWLSRLRCWKNLPWPKSKLMNDTNSVLVLGSRPQIRISLLKAPSLETENRSTQLGPALAGARAGLTLNASSVAARCSGSRQTFIHQREDKVAGGRMTWIFTNL